MIQGNIRNKLQDKLTKPDTIFSVVYMVFSELFCI